MSETINRDDVISRADAIEACEDIDIVAWMPLPEPYEEVER